MRSELQRFARSVHRPVEDSRLVYRPRINHDADREIQKLREREHYLTRVAAMERRHRGWGP